MTVYDPKLAQIGQHLSIALKLAELAEKMQLDKDSAAANKTLGQMLGRHIKYAVDLSLTIDAKPSTVKSGLMENFYNVPEEDNAGS